MALNTLLFLYTETSLHAGTGSTVSVVDLPIQRERTTKYPLVQGSGVKGALRQQYQGEQASVLFGPDTKTKNEDTYAGALSVGDARILLFPVQALAGIFAFTTSVNVLARLQRDAEVDFGLPTSVSGHALVTKQSNLIAGGKVVLEEFSFEPKKDPVVDKIADWLANNALPDRKEYAYWRDKLRTSLVILPEDDFRDFTENSTEIVTRVKLERGTKTVAPGALWTEESLPADALLYAPVLVNSARDGSKVDAQSLASDLVKQVPARIQLGGDETTGSGFVALRWL